MPATLPRSVLVLAAPRGGVGWSRRGMRAGRLRSGGRTGMRRMAAARWRWPGPRWRAPRSGIRRTAGPGPAGEAGGAGGLRRRRRRPWCRQLESSGRLRVKWRGVSARIAWDPVRCAVLMRSSMPGSGAVVACWVSPMTPVTVQPRAMAWARQRASCSRASGLPPEPAAYTATFVITAHTSGAACQEHGGRRAVTRSWVRAAGPGLVNPAARDGRHRRASPGGCVP